MNRHVLICSLLLTSATSGCHSGLTESSSTLADVDVLAGPYQLRLSVSPKSAVPSDHVTVSVEFENTGSAALWIPRNQETCLSYEQGGTSGGGLTPSSCDGIRYVKVSPGKVVRYEKDFVVPPLYGEIKIHLLNRRDISVPLEVKRGPNSEGSVSQQPTPGAG